MTFSCFILFKTMMNNQNVPFNYYAAYSRVIEAIYYVVYCVITCFSFKIKDLLPQDSIIVSEGANTMDTSRSVLNHRLPRHRLAFAVFFNKSAYFILTYL